jgi:hypothetical protein
MIRTRSPDLPLMIWGKQRSVASSFSGEKEVSSPDPFDFYKMVLRERIEIGFDQI